MALTKEHKMMIDTETKALADFFVSNLFSSFREIAKVYENNYNHIWTSQAIIASFKRNGMYYAEEDGKYFIGKGNQYTVHNFIKDKEKLYLTDTSNNKLEECYYSFEDKKWHYNVPKTDFTYKFTKSWCYDCYMGIVLTKIKKAYYNNTSIPDKEWIFNDSVKEINPRMMSSDTIITENLPKNYLNYLKKSRANTMLANDSIRIFSLSQLLDIPADVTPLIPNINISKEYLNYFKKQITTCRNILTREAKNLDIYNLRDDTYRLRSTIELLLKDSFYYENNINIDINRSLEYNYNVLHNAKLSKKIAEKQNRIDILNNFDIIINNIPCKVVVPKNIADLIEEGRQQNNCVGSFYNQSIADNINLIYFIRKADNLKHSFITCRYNVHNEKTVETRLVNNYSISFDTREIDNIITSLLQKEGM